MNAAGLFLKMHLCGLRIKSIVIERPLSFHKTFFLSRRYRERGRKSGKEKNDKVSNTEDRIRVKGKGKREKVAIEGRRREESATFLWGFLYRELPGDSPSRNFEQLSFTCYPVADLRLVRWIGGSLRLASCIYVE